jgi:hypothetical protein
MLLYIEYGTTTHNCIWEEGFKADPFCCSINGMTGSSLQGFFRTGNEGTSSMQSMTGCPEEEVGPK